ncbi:MAG: hypothetical protein LBS21_01535 [Clostridiales bacterium]|jgi:hypothetical protein|nr:hypothetical protein [Clostridiales bacterium]
MAARDKITREGKKFFKEIERLKKLQMQVGYQHGEAVNEDGADVADIAMFNELGTENIPARPFLRQSVDNHADKINAMCKAQLRGITSGSKTAEDALNALGVMQKGLVQNEIRNGSFVKNAPSTVARKHGSEQPLIDTGQMRDSVQYVIAKKGEGK